MNLSYGASIFGLISMAAVFAGAFKIKKSERELYGSVWLPASVIAVTCYHVLIAAVLNLIHIPVNIISIGLFDFILAAVLWYLIIRKKYSQVYKYEWIDGIYLAVLLAVVSAFAYQRYGFQLNIHYQTIDPAAHLKSAMDVVNGQRIDSMFYASLHNALLIEIVGAFTSLGNYYKIFVFADILHLCMAGLMFWGVIRRYCKDNFLKAAGVILSMVYLLAYPLNSTIFGFVYLGMGVTIIAYLIVVTDEFIRGNLHKWLNIVLISLGCLGIFETYVLFMPVTFFAILGCILVKQYKNKVLLSLDTIVTGLAIFLIPSAIGLLYTYLGIFGGETSVGSAIAGEGAIYRDLYSNFIWIMPLALYGVWSLIRARKNRLLLYILPFLSVFVFVLLCRGLDGKVSSYYYYKNYYLLWLLVFVLAFIGMSYIDKKTRALLAAGFMVWAFTGFLLVFNIEERINAKKPLFCAWSKASTYHDIYSFNKDAIMLPAYPIEKVELFQYAVTNYLENDKEEMVPLAGYWEDFYWMEAVTNQRLNGFDYWNYDDDYFFEHLKEVNYVIVLTDSEFYAKYEKYFNSLERVFENTYGFIAEVK